MKEALIVPGVGRILFLDMCDCVTLRGRERQAARGRGIRSVTVPV
jgi:hypothetical protein